MALMQELFDLGWPRALITLDEWDTLPADNETRVECVEGMVVMMAPADSYHQRAIVRLLAAFAAVLPADLEVLPEVGVVLEDDPLTVRIPDLSVVPFLDEQRERFRGDEIVLAIEIVSPGSRRTDQVTKFSEYAEAHIGEYWILDRRELVLWTYALSGDGYLLTGEHRGSAVIETCGVNLTLDVSRLV